jgi:glycosyltransferase involved in cell wall biosynthesis
LVSGNHLNRVLSLAIRFDFRYSAFFLCLRANLWLLDCDAMSTDVVTVHGPHDAPAADALPGVVVIGRNEGARLVRCIEACRRARVRVVYVDSGSADGSPEAARRLGASVVALDMSIPFTAARARNEGFAALMRLQPALVHVQFLDGDCELADGWLAEAVSFLGAHPQIAAVCGRRRERFPAASVYNQLCDIEWNTPVGEARAFGGDVMIRVEALTAVHGYRPDLIAGEEPELCVRLRRTGWRIWRLPQDMTWHDAGMTRWMQWWRRNVRSGHAFAEGAALHGAPPERHFVAETRRALLWGGILPLALLLLTLLSGSFAWLWLIYPLQWLRIGTRFARARMPIPWRYAAFLVLARFPEAWGVLKFSAGRLSGRRSGLIEYK